MENIEVKNAINAISEMEKRLEDDISREVFYSRFKYMMYRDIDAYRNEVLDIVEKNNGVWKILELDRICKDRTDIRGIVIFGCGVNGRQTYRLIKHSKYNNLPIVFCDNDQTKWGDNLFDTKIISPTELEKTYRDYICIIGSSVYRQQILEQILDEGFPNYNILYPYMGIIFADCGKQYFDFFDPISDEVFVDGGVYDGVTAGVFHNWCNGKYKKIFGFEANPYCVDRCKEYYTTHLHDSVIIEKALWNEKALLKFSGGYSGAARVSDSGGVSVEADTMDSVLSGQRVTLIKMDIEGAEYNALRGAEKTIKQNHPRMAISIYHRPCDIVEIPYLIMKFDDTYRFALRHYRSIGDETVLYAF